MVGPVALVYKLHIQGLITYKTKLVDKTKTRKMGITLTPLCLLFLVFKASSKASPFT